MSTRRKDKSSDTRKSNLWKNADEKYKKEKKETFISELKQKYLQQYNNVQPIPYVKEKLFSIEMVFVEGGMEYYSGSSWMNMGSYKESVIAPPKSATRSFILGGAGYGKSTLALQYAYDWCNAVKDSFLKNFEIMILLRLRQMAGFPSIFSAIRRFILPKQSTINESDIKQILGASTSAVFILDGLDEYPEEDVIKDSDVMKIILNKMFQNFEIIITSRYLPGYRSDMEAKCLRLTGFTVDAQERYIQRAVVGEKLKAQKIMQDLHDNPVLEDFCQIPLFFVMFAHMSHEEEKEDFASFKTVTGFFKNMIKCFHAHMKNKLKDANVQQYFLYEKDHRELDLLAFRGLSGDRRQLVWPKDYLRERLGEEFYDQYVRIGILVEEEVLKGDPNSPGNTQIEVSFFHKLFCEWYAAHYVTYVIRSEVISLHDFFKRIEPAGNQYMYRFACGLSREASEKIIKYLKGKTDGSQFAILCIMEQDGITDNVLDNVKDLCSRKVVLARDQSNLLQRSTIQLLEIASTQRVNISEVWLNDCYHSFDQTFEKIILTSKLHLPVLDTLRELDIRGQKEVTETNTNGAFHYASLCPHLKKLGFSFCLVPKRLHCRKWLLTLESRNVQVLWYPNNQWYILNFEHSCWEYFNVYQVPTGRLITDKDYHKEKERFLNPG